MAKQFSPLSIGNEQVPEKDVEEIGRISVAETTIKSITENIFGMQYIEQKTQLFENDGKTPLMEEGELVFKSNTAKRRKQTEAVASLLTILADEVVSTQPNKDGIITVPIRLDTNKLKKRIAETKQ